MPENDAFSIEGRAGAWWFYAYVDGNRIEYGPYATKETAEAARNVVKAQREAAKGVREIR